MRVKHRPGARTFQMVADDEALTSHAGLVVVEEVARQLGLERALTAGLGLSWRTQPPGRTLVRMAQTLIAGGDCVSHLRGLRDQPALFAEETAHETTAWRLLAERLPGEPLHAIAQARAQARERAWRAGLRPRTLTIDLDAHLVTSHTEAKEGAFSTYKGGFGFHPLLAYLSETNEALAGILRPGAAPAQDADDQLELVDLALAQLPADVEPDEILVRADAAGYVKEVVSGLAERGLRFQVGARLVGVVREAVLSIPPEDWAPIAEEDGTPREGAWVAEAAWPAPAGWPEGLRLVVRRERPHPGAQLSFSDEGGHRYLACLSNDHTRDAPALERAQRQHAVVEDRIREARQLGLHNLPFGGFLANHAWLQVVLLAQDLVSWTQGLTRHPGAAWMEPRTFRFTLVAVAGRITRHARRLTMHLPRTWPWSLELIDAYRRARRIGALALM